MDSKEKILIGSMELFAKYGIKSVTMDFIAEHLGVSKRTIYENFKDKNSLLKEGVCHGGKAHGEKLQQLLHESENVIEALYLIGEENQRVMARINPSFFNDLFKHYPLVFKEMNEGFLHVSRRIMEQLFRQGMEEGIFEKEYQVEQLGLVWQKLATMISKDIQEYNGETQMLVWHKHLIEPYLRGICTDKGRILMKQYFEKLCIESADKNR